MSRPITWQNVGSTASIADANSALLGASRLFNTGFDSINNVVKQAQATDEANWNQAKVNNTEAFYNAIASRYATPEAYQAAVASGDVAREMAKYGAQIDQSNARKFMDNQMGVLQDRARKAVEYTNFSIDEKQRPIVESIKAQAALGNRDAALQLMKDTPDLRLPSALTQAIVSGERDLTKFNNDTTTANLTQQAKRQELNQNDAKFKVWEKDQADRKTAEELLKQSLLGFQEAEGVRSTKLNNLVTSYGVKVKPDGTVDVSSLPLDKAKALQAEIVAQGLDNSTSSTAARENLRNSLFKSGVAPSVIDSTLTLADNHLVSKPALSKEDKEARDNKITLVDDLANKIKKENFFYSDPTEHANEKEKVLARVDKEIKDGPMTRTRMRETFANWMDKGIPIYDEKQKKTVYVPVTPKIIDIAFTSGKEDDTTVINSTVENMSPMIKQMLTSPEYQTLREQADWLRAEGDVVKRRQIKDNARYTSGSKSPTDLADQLDTQLKLRLNTK